MREFLDGDRWTMPSEGGFRGPEVSFPLRKPPKYEDMLPQIVEMAEAGSGVDLISRALGIGAEVVRDALHCTFQPAFTRACPTGPLRVPQRPVMHRIRNACDASLTFSSLVRHLSDMQTMTPFFAHVVGTKPTQQVVVEGTSETFRTRRAKPGKALIQTNHFVHAAHRHHNGEEYQGRDCDICDRYAALEKRLRKKPKDFADAFSRIRGRPVTYSETMNQIAFQPADGTAVVRVRK